MTARTEGWPVGLYLAALIATDSDKGLRISGDDRYVADFLYREALLQLPDSDQRFLRRTAVLDQLCAPLCDAVVGAPGAQERLRKLVASIAVECGVPFVCVTAGTRNHFAQDLDLDRQDPRTSVHAFRNAVERRIDYATVNDRFFVNNVSLGVYAALVQQDAYRDAKVETTKSMLPELLGKTNEPFDLQFTGPDGAAIDGAFVIQVSNNPYALGSSFDAGQRRRVDTDQLGVIALTGTTGKDAAALLALDAVGQRSRSRNWHEFTMARFEVRSRSGRSFAGVDGEALEMTTPMVFRIEMTTPMVFRIYPHGLRLLVPEGNLEVAVQRRARNVSLCELLEVARDDRGVSYQRKPSWL